MPVHLTDSLIYQNSWGTPELRGLFDDVPRTHSWLQILAVLAETQAEFGLIPPDAAQAVATTCRTVELDEAFFEEVRAGFEATNHSTLGLIRALQKRCPGNSGEWLYYGATVQDITDTWTALVLRRVREIVGRELKEIEANLSRLATEHRDTAMAGRTHGQIGLPITFGFKAAIWAMEVRRHRQRLVELASRLNVGQLAGGVGSLSSLGPRALELQKSFLARLGLDAPARVSPAALSAVLPCRTSVTRKSQSTWEHSPASFDTIARSSLRALFTTTSAMAARGKRNGRY